MKTIVLADDEPIVRMDLTDMLSSQDYTVVGAASDGFDAVELCRCHHPDIVLLDVHMPVFNGLTAAQTIVDENLAGCVLLLTAFSDRDIVEKATEVGVSGYLLKPIEPGALRPAIEVAWAQSQRLRLSAQARREAEEKSEELQLIERARAYVAKQQNISGEEAYAFLRSTAMDRRCSVASVAKALLAERDSTTRTINKAKAVLMEERHFSESAAYQYICRQAEHLAISPEAYARSILRKQNK